MDVCPERITPSTGTVSPGRTRILSPIATWSAGMIFSESSVMTRALRGVRWTSFSIPALALATVRSSSSAPSCMMKATSPAAKSSPMQTDAMRARETSTSALMSKAVISPMTASMMIGMPQRMIAIQAASKGSGIRSNRLMISDRPPRTRKAMSFRIPPSSIKASVFSINLFIMKPPHYTYRGIPILYPYGYSASRRDSRL